MQRFLLCYPSNSKIEAMTMHSLDNNNIWAFAECLYKEIATFFDFKLVDRFAGQSEFLIQTVCTHI